MVTHPLNKIICHLDKGSAASQSRSNSSSEKIVVINKLKQEVLPKVPLFGSSNISYLLVRNSNDASHIAECSDISATINDFAKDRKLSLSIAYRAICRPGNEEKLALSLCKGTNPGFELEQKILGWVAQLTDQRASNFICNFDAHVDELQNSLAVAAKEQVGLTLNVRISLPGKAQLEPVKIGSPEATTFTVYVCDSDDPIDLKLQTELAVDNSALALSSQEPGWIIRLVTLVKEEIKSYLIKNISLSQFYYELKDTVRNGLAVHLNKVISGEGRKVAYLYLDSKAISEASVPKELVEINHTVQCKVQKYTKKISVDNTLQMIPHDVRRYISAQSPNLQAWVENKLEKIIKPLLLGKKYVDVLIDFSNEAEVIRESMQIEAMSIGYSIQHIVSLPELEHLELKENLEITDDGEEEFRTNETAIKVALTTTANVKFETFERIEDYLNKPVSDVKELIKETINSKTREILRTIDPERFYMRFYVIDEDTSEKSVEQELKDEIKRALEDRFGAKVLRVVPIPNPTEIIDNLQRLMGMIGSFECTVPSLSGGEAIKFRGDFKVQGIEKGSWYIFQSVFESMRKSQTEMSQELSALKKQYSDVIDTGDVEDNQEELDSISVRIRKIENQIYGMDDIQKTIAKSIRSKLMTVDPQLLQFNDIKLSSTIERYINQWASASVIDQYGLEISVRHLERDRTLQETELFAAQQRLASAKVKDALVQVEARQRQQQKRLEMTTMKGQSQTDDLNRLYAERSKMISDIDTDPDDLKYLTEKIKELEEELLNTSLTDTEDDLSILQPRRVRGSSAINFESEISDSPNSENSSSREE